MEKRNIQIDKGTAIKWYNGNDNTLKELALQAYKEEELREPVIKTYQDLIDNRIKISGSWITGSSHLEQYQQCILTEDERNLATSEKIAKSMLAMAMISQLMPYYGGEITEDEWNYANMLKYTIKNERGKIYTTHGYIIHEYLAFHTEEQRDNFLKYNEQLVKDYLMID